MEEYDPDMDQMLFYLPLSGSTFKKVYFDPRSRRAVAKFIPAQDLVVPYSASDLSDERLGLRMYCGWMRTKFARCRLRVCTVTLILRRRKR